LPTNLACLFVGGGVRVRVCACVYLCLYVCACECVRVRVCFVPARYVLLPGWDGSDPEHQRLMQLHLYGNGAARTPTIAEDLAMFEAAGFRVEEHYDFANLGYEIYGDQAFPWWGDLQFNWYFSLLPAHPWVRRPLPAILRGLAWLGLVPADVPRVAELMNDGGDGLSGLGKLNAITPQYYVLAIKPEA
jgi:sterol 24-C-methyltransferase